jgi:hypothetical protein
VQRPALARPGVKFSIVISDVPRERGDPYSVSVRSKHRQLQQGFVLTTTAGGYGSLRAQGRRHYLDFVALNHGRQSKKPGRTAGLFLEAKRLVDQAAGLNNFDALALIGSTVSVATFWDSSASSLL